MPYQVCEVAHIIIGLVNPNHHSIREVKHLRPQLTFGWVATGESRPLHCHRSI
jgi:hypothetical protein